MFSSLFRKPRTVALPRTADDRRIYAIGDIHGRIDCLNDLLDQIATDDDARGPAPTTLIFLGDLVDRGPASRAVVERLIEIGGSEPDCVFLMGNHEEVLLRAAEGDRGSLALFDRIGGRETLLSYGVDADEYDSSSLSNLSSLITRAVPREHRDFMEGMAEHHLSADYLFVHAGVRPGVELARQKSADLRWIRDEFLAHRGDFGHVVVHGHTISTDIEVHHNRIGIDVGAYRTGRLAAVGLEGADRWFLISDTDAG